MSHRNGKFIQKHFKNKKIEIYTGDESSWLSYFDHDMMNHSLIIGTVKDFDEDSGIITLLSETNKIFYMSEDNIVMFWEAEKGFNLRDTTSTVIKTGKKPTKNKDIM